MVKKKETKQKILKNINDHKQTMYFGIIIAILFCWTGVGLIIGLLLALLGHELKSKEEQKLWENE